MYELKYKEFENKIQRIFEEAIESLPPEENWSIDNNLRTRNKVECDILISKENKPYAIVEIKYGDRLFGAGVRQAMRVAYTYKSPYLFVVSNNKFGFLSAGGNLIVSHNKRITYRDICKCLESDFQKEFENDKWDDKINDLISEIRHSEDEIVRNKANDICDALESLKSPNLTVVDEELSLGLRPEIEEKLFSALLGTYNKQELCRFTTLSSLFRTLNDVKHSMCSIVAMNDKSETSYVDNYLQSQNFNSLQFIISGPDDWNNCFITSCCDADRIDDFTMSRLYADDAKGVAIMYQVVDPMLPNFILHPVSYQRSDDSHPELDILITLMSIKINGYTLNLPSFNRWKHFFKPKEYEFEKEVRLLYITPANDEPVSGIDNKWILNSEFNIITPLIEISIEKGKNKCPLIFNEIKLGAKMSEAIINCRQIESLFKIKGIENGQNVIINISNISHYR